MTGGLELPSLTRILSRSRAERYSPLTTEAWLCQAFEVERQQDWPIAPLTAALDNADTGNAYWLRADPVHIKVDRDRALLVDNALFDMTSEEAQAFAAALNHHFAADEIVFLAAAPKRWYVKLPRAPRLATHELSEVAGKDVHLYLPTGPDGLEWHRIFNEVQMLLHAHGVNDVREARGEPAVNSVWLWGGGTRPAVTGRHFDSVWSDDTTATALAAAADARTAGVPADAASWLKMAGARQVAGRSHLVVLGELASAVAYHDDENWRTRVLALESDWFAPLERAVRGGDIAGLTLVVTSEESCWRFETTRSDLLKFWRGTKPLSSYYT